MKTKKIITVHEYDFLHCSQKYRDSKFCLSNEEFENFCKFIQKKPKEENDFFRFSYHPKYGKIIQLKTLVGTIKLSEETQLEILPKLSLSKYHDREILLKMIEAYFEEYLEISDFSLAKEEELSIIDIMIKIYLSEVSRLTKRGLRCDYINFQENLPFCKGKILFHQQIKYNFIHKERVYSSYDEFHTNRVENRVIKSCLLKLAKISSDFQNQAEISRQLSYFEAVQPSFNITQDFSQIKINRNLAEYKKVLAWSKIFLTGKSFNVFNGEEEFPAILFPMEKLYESYVASYIKRIFSSWSVRLQDRKYAMFDSPNEFFRLIPDIVCSKENHTVIMDTKWKELKSQRENFGIQSADIYQMYAYSNKYRAENQDRPANVWLLYPKNNNFYHKKHHQMEYFQKFTSSQENIHIYIYFIDIENIDKSIEILYENIQNSV